MVKVLGFGEKNNYLTLVKEDIIIQNDGMQRKAANTGAFAQYTERMSKKHIRAVAKECGIDLGGLILKIEQNEDLISLDITGIADPEHNGTIIY